MLNIQVLESVIADQRNECNAIFNSKSLITRDISLKTLQAALVQPNALVISGVRRSGKSVLALQVGSGMDFAYLNFADERLLDLKSSDLHLIEKAFFSVLGKEPEVLIFDEIQTVKGWELFVNRLRRTKKLIITGSNAHLLSSELATHLTGRHLSFNVLPFSFAEFVRFKTDSKLGVLSTQDVSRLRVLFKEYLQLGGFPETYSLGSMYPGQVYGDIVSKDIIVRRRIRHHETFRRLAQHIISTYAKEVSFRRLSSIFQIKDSHTVANYCQYLSETYLTYFVRRFSAKLRAISKAERKVYCIDPGIVRCVATEMMESESRLLENVIFLELQRRIAYRRLADEIFFWRDADSGVEVDFVVRARQRATEFIQVCYSLSRPETRAREFRGVSKALAAGLAVDKLTLVSMDEEGQEKVDGNIVEIIPAWKWLMREAEYTNA